METEQLQQQVPLQQEVLPSFEVNLVPASTGIRFANYIIDLISFYLLIIFWGVIVAIVNPQTIESLDYSSNDMGASLLDRLVTLILFGLYIGFMEAIFGGKTLGKFITGTRAVNDYEGTNISAITAFKRGFCRMVPFEPFSAFSGYPWHDKWTDTIVISERESTR